MERCKYCKELIKHGFQLCPEDHGNFRWKDGGVSEAIVVVNSDYDFTWKYYCDPMTKEEEFNYLVDNYYEIQDDKGEGHI